MKKIVLALLIAVVAFTFVGCPKVYGDLDIDWDSAEGGNEAFGVATIDTTKDEPSEEQRRGMRFLATKHTDLACKVEIEDVTAAGSSVMGLAFAQESEKVTINYRATIYANDQNTSKRDFPQQKI